MNKAEFLTELKKGLSGLPEEDVSERLQFYAEMIDDRMEEGLSEEQAVAGAGSVSEIVSQTVAETPITKIVKEKMKPGRTLKGWEIALLILGFPLWFPLLLAAGAVVLGLYIVLWSLIVSLWAAEAALWACSLGGLCAAFICFFGGDVPQGLAFLAAALVCSGLSVFMFLLCVSATKGVIKLTGRIALGIKTLIIGKE